MDNLTNLTQKRLISAQTYECEMCDYTTSRKSKYIEHLSTDKHKNLTNLTILRTEIRPHFFCCEYCDYSTSEKKHYTAHLSTLKHKKAVDPPVESPYICNACSRSFNSRQTLHSHKKKCILPSVNKQDMGELVIELIKQNHEFKQMIIEQNNKMIEMSQRENTVINNNTTTNNQQFNLNMFLNEQCKDAMNFVDFVDSLQITFEELENMAHKGYVCGMSDIILNGLRQLDIYHRPIHCTDMKRETMYIKDNNEWAKDENQIKIQKIINMVSKKNMRKVPEWQNANPKSDITDSKEQYLHMNIMQQCLNSASVSESKRNDAKIIKNIAKFTYLDRGKNLV